MDPVVEVSSVGQSRPTARGSAGPGVSIVRNVVDRLGANGAAFLSLRSGLVGASHAVIHGSAGERCLATLSRRNLILPAAPPEGPSCTALPVPGGLDGSSQLWIAAAYDAASRPKALLVAAFGSSAERAGPLLVQLLEESLAPASPGELPWSEALESLSHSGQSSNLLAAAVGTGEEILLLTPALGEALGLGGPAVGHSLVDLANGDAVAGRIRALARGEADPAGVLQLIFRRSLGDGTMLLWLREPEEARLVRQLLRFSLRNRLTQAERAALQDIARGLSAKESAQRLSLSPETVRARRKRIFRKVGADGCGTVMAQLLGTAKGAAPEGA